MIGVEGSQHKARWFAMGISAFERVILAQRLQVNGSNCDLRELERWEMRRRRRRKDEFIISYVTTSREYERFLS